MAKRINIKGDIIPNDYQWIYDWLEWDATSPKVIESALNDASGDDLEVIINSPGGDVFSGSEIYSLLNDYKGNVTIKVVGVAASAASVIAMAGDKVLISPTAQIMIHNVSAVSAGDYRDHAHESDVLRNWNKSIANAYALKSGLPESELLAMMNKETWLNAQQAIEKGFADEIMFDDTGSLKLTASASGILPPQIVNKIRNELIKLKGREEEMKIDNNLQTEPQNHHQQPTPAPQNTVEHHPQAFGADQAEQERKRLQEIDAIAANIDPALVNEAKYGTNRMTAQELAFKAMQEGKMIQAGVFSAAVQANAASGAPGVGAAPQPQNTEPEYDLANLSDVNKVFRAFDAANEQRWYQRQPMMGGRI